MSAQEVHQLPIRIPEPDHRLDPVSSSDMFSLSYDVCEVLTSVANALRGIEDELNRWRNGQFVGAGSEPPEVVVTVPDDTTVTSLDEYGRAPIVQILTESTSARWKLLDGRTVDLVGWAVDSNGESWPMVRTAEQPRPVTVRDTDQWDDQFDRSERQR